MRKITEKVVRASISFDPEILSELDRRRSAIPLPRSTYLNLMLQKIFADEEKPKKRRSP